MNGIANSSVDDPEQRIASEFQRCPGLRLTLPQAARLWGLPRDRVELILSRLIDQQLLKQTANGVYSRRGGCPRCE